MNKPQGILAVILAALLTACGSGTDENAAPTSAESSTIAPSSASSDKVSAKQSYSGPDIAGVFIGMSPEEAEAQLKAYDSSINVRSSSQYFNYRVFGTSYKTDPFLSVMVGSIPGGSINIEVGFTYPPKPPKVVSVLRVHRQSTNPVSQADYAASLVDKYGTPSRDESGKAGSQVERILEWTIPGGITSCLADQAMPTAGNSILDRMVQDGRRLADPTFEFTQNCAFMLKYKLLGDPVVHAVGAIMDVATAAASEFASRAWVQSQIDAKSQAGTEKPKL